nr:putative ribonuclease H-like domain-containing protein [Tanacetum cinerariifolium]
IEKGAGPNWLFDIDSLNNSMNYVPVVVVGINSTNFLGTKEVAGQDVKKDVSSLRYTVNWFHEAHLESSTSNAQDTCSADAPESRIDYDEVFAPVARIEAIRLFLAYASFMEFIVYQMDVKSAFLYGTIDEEVYVMQPP